MNTAEHSGLRQVYSIKDRECARFIVPGATISCKRSGFWHLWNDYAPEERLPVVDISKHGISFLTDNPPRWSRVSLILRYSDCEKVICLEGRVVYSLPRSIGHSYRYRVGVCFDSFSTNKNDNPLGCLKILEELGKGYDLVSA